MDRPHLSITTRIEDPASIFWSSAFASSGFEGRSPEGSSALLFFQLWGRFTPETFPRSARRNDALLILAFTADMHGLRAGGECCEREQQYDPAHQSRSLSKGLMAIDIPAFAKDQFLVCPLPACFEHQASIGKKRSLLRRICIAK